MHDKETLRKQVIIGGREYGIGSVLFRHVVAERLGVNDTDMECLGAIFFRHLATPTELSRHTGLSSGATTAMLDRLERAGLIKRRPNPQDRRSTHIVIAENGKRKVGPLFASLREQQQKLVSHYSKQELDTILDYFNKSAVIWESERTKLVAALKDNHKL
jgi:DNA-binding MarR family transcriptional regulator